MGRVRGGLSLAVIAAAAAVIVLLGYGVISQRTDSSIDDAVSRASDRRLQSRHCPCSAPRARIHWTTITARSWCSTLPASWCPPAPRSCRCSSGPSAESNLAAPAVLGVNYKDIPEDALVRSAVDLSFPSLRDRDGEYAERYATIGFPETFVIDRRGRIAARRRTSISRSSSARCPAARRAAVMLRAARDLGAALVLALEPRRCGARRAGPGVAPRYRGRGHVRAMRHRAQPVHGGRRRPRAGVHPQPDPAGTHEGQDQGCTGRALQARRVGAARGRGFGLAAYLVPLLAALLATAVVLVTARRWRRTTRPAAIPHRLFDPDGERRLGHPELREHDRERSPGRDGAQGGAMAAMGSCTRLRPCSVPPLLAQLAPGLAPERPLAAEWLARHDRQLSLFAGAYYAYRLVRGFVDGQAGLAYENARALVDLERALGLFFEPGTTRPGRGEGLAADGRQLDVREHALRRHDDVPGLQYLARNHAFYYVLYVHARDGACAGRLRRVPHGASVPAGGLYRHGGVVRRRVRRVERRRALQPLRGRAPSMHVAFALVIAVPFFTRPGAGCLRSYGLYPVSSRSSSSSPRTTSGSTAALGTLVAAVSTSPHIHGARAARRSLEVAHRGGEGSGVIEPSRADPLAAGRGDRGVHRVRVAASHAQPVDRVAPDAERNLAHRVRAQHAPPRC